MCTWIKWDDINKIETSGDTITLTLGNKVQCYAKPAGERNTVNMEVVKDITGGAKTISFFVVVLRQHLCSPTAFRQLVQWSGVECS